MTAFATLLHACSVKYLPFVLFRFVDFVINKYKFCLIVLVATKQCSRFWCIRTWSLLFISTTIRGKSILFLLCCDIYCHFCIGRSNTRSFTIRCGCNRSISSTIWSDFPEGCQQTSVTNVRTLHRMYKAC